MRNATTDSPWLVTNNPQAKYNLRVREDGTARENCNLDLPLWQLVRASTAAPVFFAPEIVKVGQREFCFVDGGMTTYNCPAFQLFLMATTQPYNLNWGAGEDRMLLVSVGTGLTPQLGGRLGASFLAENVQSMPLGLMSAAMYEQDLLCRMFGRCLVGDVLDREVGDMIGADNGPSSQKLFTYLRYNAELTDEGLAKLDSEAQKAGEDFRLREVRPGNVAALDSVEHIEELSRIGGALATQVKPEHFAGFVLP